MRARSMAIVLGFLGGLTLFFATVSLLIRGGENVGQHLRLLRYYCPGFDVTWGGAFIGFFWGALYGVLAGYAFAWIYNRVSASRGASR